MSCCQITFFWWVEGDLDWSVLDTRPFCVLWLVERVDHGETMNEKDLIYNYFSKMMLSISAMYNF